MSMFLVAMANSCKIWTLGLPTPIHPLLSSLDHPIPRAASQKARFDSQVRPLFEPNRKVRHKVTLYRSVPVEPVPV